MDDCSSGNFEAKALIQRVISEPTVSIVDHSNHSALTCINKPGSLIVAFSEVKSLEDDY
jgi:hypothetical protein